MSKYSKLEDTVNGNHYEVHQDIDMIWEELQTLKNKYDRLMKHLGLTEVEQPATIKLVGKQATYPTHGGTRRGAGRPKGSKNKPKTRGQKLAATWTPERRKAQSERMKRIRASRRDTWGQ